MEQPLEEETRFSASEKKILEKENSLSYVAFDPRPPEHRKLHKDAIEELHCDLLAQNEIPAFLELLVPSVDKIKHDYSYSKALPTTGCQVIMSTQMQKLEGAESTDFPFFILDGAQLERST